MTGKPAKDPAFDLPLTTGPMEAKSADALPEDPGVWQYEPTRDGFRCLAFKSGGDVDLQGQRHPSLGSSGSGDDSSRGGAEDAIRPDTGHRLKVPSGSYRGRLPFIG